MMKDYGVAFCLLWLLISDASLALAEQPTRRPNILLILVDDLRTSLGCYGDKLAQSPNIDRLAASSRLFNRAYCQQSVCGPSRASILTGLVPDNTAVWHNRNRFRATHPKLVTLPQLFKNNGYHTQGLGKIFSNDEREEDPQSWTIPTLLHAPGWDNYALPENRVPKGKGVPIEMADVPDNGYIDGKLAELAIETLETLKHRDQPFFMGVGFFKPHLPFNAPKKYWELYDPRDFELDSDITRTRGAPKVAYPDHLELAGYKGVPKDERLSLEQARQVRHGYYACVSYIDAQVGKLLDALQRFNLDSNTIVVFLSDHGFSLGEAGHWCKDTNFELDTRVPLIIRTPSLVHPGVATDALVECVDLYPTIVSLANLSPPELIDGHNITTILQDPLATVHDAVLSQFSRPFAAGEPLLMGYSIRTNNHRYTRWIDWKSKNVQAEELYDYTSSSSVSQKGVLQVERNNVSEMPAYSELRDFLNNRLNRKLAQRSKPAIPDTRQRR